MSECSAVPEVLAPGGSIGAVAAAIASGADAVYVGLGLLNARTRAANPDGAGYARLVAGAHRAGVRVYAPFNVPVQPETLAAALEGLVDAWLAGADAVIVRDPYLMELVREHLPGMALHASTQFGVAGPAGARRARELGCERVILARECSLADIRRIHEAEPELALESFLFGAMCFGVSGRCLLGEAVGGRSGNYGNCLQACRLEYFDAAGRSLGRPLSLKDLDFLRRVGDLVESGVSALKIEGRLKSPAWVGCVTHWARRAADQWRDGGLSRGEHEQFALQVETLFSRPRTDGWLDGKRDAAVVSCPEVSGHQGLEVSWFRQAKGPRGPRLLVRAAVALEVRDGLLLTCDAAGHAEEVPLAMTDLRDGSGRRVRRIEAGEEGSVPMPAGLDVRRVGVHSAQAVRRLYEPSARAMDALQGADAPVVLTAVTVAADSVQLTGRLGRTVHTSRYTVDTEPARGGGLDAERLRRFFPDADCRVETEGLYLNPSVLKRLRREHRAAVAVAREAERAAVLDRLARHAAAAPPRYVAPDARLVRQVPAAFSRVTGLREGRVETSGGDSFEIVATRRGTLLRWPDGCQSEESELL